MSVLKFIDGKRYHLLPIKDLGGGIMLYRNLGQDALKFIYVKDNKIILNNLKLSISSVGTDNQFYSDDTNVPVVGYSFGLSAGDVELCNNIDYDSATVKVGQTIVSWSGTLILIDVDSTGLF